MAEIRLTLLEFWAILLQCVNIGITMPFGRESIGLRRKVTEKHRFQLTEQIIYADKCRGATPATNRS